MRRLLLRCIIPRVEWFHHTQTGHVESLPVPMLPNAKGINSQLL